MTTEIQNLINNYLHPLLGLVIFMGLVVGIAKNFDAINDSSGSGRRKEGIIAVVYMVGYVIVVVAIIAVAVTKIAAIKMTI